ncbi:MAG: hypothetical protein JKY09_07335 [Crocinitomicaceae bacterium]|nr:hypothetical protein [Crocinitomicaceae bacterium]
MLQPIFKKSVIIFGMVVSLFAVNSCSTEPDNDSTDGEVVVADDYYEFQDFDLSKYDIPAIISLPDETANIGASTKPEIIHVDNDIKWEINVGPNFQLLVEDYAALTDLIEVEKKDLANKKFFKVKYLIDEDDMILYERTLLVKGTDKASPAVGVEHKSYHVYCQKVIDGITYELKSREEGYEKEIIELMAKSMRSFKPSSVS